MIDQYGNGLCENEIHYGKMMRFQTKEAAEEYVYIQYYAMDDVFVESVPVYGEPLPFIYVIVRLIPRRMYLRMNGGFV